MRDFNSTLRWTHRTSQLLIQLIVIVALIYTGVVHAAHFHKADENPYGTFSSPCVICLDSGHVGAPPTAVSPQIVSLVGLVEIGPVVSMPIFAVTAHLYRARGPPSF